VRVKKKELWPSVGKEKMSLKARQSAEKIITDYKSKTGLPLETLLKYAGISQRTWHEWMLRRSIETKHNNNIPRNYFLTPQEIEAIVLFCKENQLKGYRMLRHEMIDKNIAADFSPMYLVQASITS
jgi:hypothetical protein